MLLPRVYRAAELGYVDLNRLAITGQSYGGYGTGSIITRTNIFRAAVPISGIFDLFGWGIRGRLWRAPSRRRARRPTLALPLDTGSAGRCYVTRVPLSR